eukprot:CAMPEP_0173438220 /NCGR_PEP_ID=MMETSP1357-20121228/19737_1 /TAXON_ID=77926 /ORGANISM="Hemiselmis rufescens, Strain PCC563" /LENGTH=279 /DNA_ID=CAMNT_0014403483 /DNA_START=52 /DNA_END=891 /DNA_ORIENTATION=+
MAALLPCALAFTAAPATRLPMQIRGAAAASRSSGLVMQQQRETGEVNDQYKARLAASVPTAMLLSQVMLPLQEAAASKGQWGLLEGKAVAMVHPLSMASLFLFTLFTGYQGLMWRQVRELGEELKPLSAELKALEAQEAPDAAKLSALKAEVDQLTEKRKELVSGNYKDKHFAAASALLALGVTFSIEGGCDTYLRAGKLFPGPHLFAGAGITVLWAVAAALVPQMQKGNDTARSAHIAINTVILGLFAWQIPTGFQITMNVINKTPWLPQLVADAASK